MSVSMDFSEVTRLIADLGKAASGLIDDVDRVAQRSAENIKRDLNAQAAGSSFRGMAGSVTYDRRWSRGAVEYEIGPDKDRRGGALGNIFFFGTSRGGGTGDLDRPLREEAPRLERALGDLITDRLL